MRLDPRRGPDRGRHEPFPVAPREHSGAHASHTDAVRRGEARAVGAVAGEPPPTSVELKLELIAADAPGPVDFGRRPDAQVARRPAIGPAEDLEHTFRRRAEFEHAETRRAQLVPGTWRRTPRHDQLDPSSSTHALAKAVTLSDDRAPRPKREPLSRLWLEARRLEAASRSINLLADHGRRRSRSPDAVNWVTPLAARAEHEQRAKR